MITAIDTNVLLDIVRPNEEFFEASVTALEDAAGAGSLVICVRPYRRPAPEPVPRPVLAGALCGSLSQGSILRLRKPGSRRG